MDCAERNAGAANKEQVCAKEFKALRLSAFKDQLLYNHVNERFFVNENAFKNHEAAVWRTMLYYLKEKTIILGQLFKNNTKSFIEP